MSQQKHTSGIVLRKLFLPAIIHAIAFSSGSAWAGGAAASGNNTLSHADLKKGTTVTVADNAEFQTITSSAVNGGDIDVGRNGLASDIDFNYGQISVQSDDVFAPASATNTRLNGAGAKMLISENGTAMNTTINGGYVLAKSGNAGMPASVNATIVNNGVLNIGTNGLATETVVNNRGQLLVFDKGMADGVTLNAGGELTVNGDVDNVFVNSDAVAIIGARKSDDSGGVINPEAGGHMANTILAGGELWNRYGLDTATLVKEGGILMTGSAREYGQADSGLSRDAVIDTGGLQVVDNGGTSSGTTVNTGGLLQVEYDNHSSDGYQRTLGTAKDSVIYGAMENNGGIDISTTVKTGGTYTATGDLSENQHAVSENAVIDNGGSAKLQKNAIASDWIVHGGVELSDASAEIRNSDIQNGKLWIYRGSASGTHITSGSMVNAGGSDSDTVVDDGRYYLGNTTAATSTNLTVNTGGIAQINSGTVTNATVDGEMLISPNFSQPDTLSTLQGMVDVGGTLAIYSGANTASANVSVSDMGSVNLTGQSADGTQSEFSLGQVVMQGGRIAFDSRPGFSHLALASLEGDGHFAMNTSVAELQGDFLTVTGAANGQFGVQINDSGKSPDTDAALQMIHTGAGNAEFTLTNSGGVVDAGTYEYHLVSDGTGSWALVPKAQPTPPDDTPDTPDTPTPPDDTPDTPDTPTTPDDTPDTPDTPTPPDDLPDTPVTPTPPPVVDRIVTPSTAAVLSMAAVDPLTFQAEINSVRRRLGDIRSLSHDSNVWADVINARNKGTADAGVNFEQTLTGVTLGADRSLLRDNSVTTQGLFFSYSHSDVGFRRGGNGNVDSYSIGAYASYFNDNGWYIDGILKGSRFAHEVNGRMTGGGAAEGHYLTNGIGGHVQTGKYVSLHNSYFAPYMAVTGFTTDGSHYGLSNGMDANVGNARSLQLEGGLKGGYDFSLKNGVTLQPYARVSVVQELIGDNRVKVNQDGHFQNDFSGTRGVYAAGMRVNLSQKFIAHAEASYSNGAGIESPWTGSVGISYSW